MDKLRLPFYSRALPFPSDMVVFRVLEFDDMVVRCVLPEFMDAEAMLPTTEIKIKRGKKVRDYIKVKGEYVAEVSRVQIPSEKEKEDGEVSPKIDLSMKAVTGDETKSVFTKYARMNKVLQVVGGAAGYKQAAAEHMLYALGVAAEPKAESDLFTFCEQILITGNTFDLPAVLIDSIRQRIQMPSFTLEKEIEIEFKGELNATDKIKVILDKIAKMDGMAVHIVAPPKYKVIAVASTKAKAEEMLACFDDPFYLTQLLGRKKKQKKAVAPIQ